MSAPAGCLPPEDVAGLAMLDAADPARRAADAHARECPECRRALEGAARTLALLDEALPEAPAPAVLARAHDAVLAEWAQPSPRRAPFDLAASLPIAAAAAAAWALFLGTAHRRSDGGMLYTVAGGLLALAGALGVVSRDRLALGVGLIGSLGFALAVGQAGPLDVAAGIACGMHELMTALAPLGVAAVVAAVRPGAVSPLGFAAASASGALAGQAVLHLACADAHALPHLLAFHVGAVFLSALLGSSLSLFPSLRAAKA